MVMVCFAALASLYLYPVSFVSSVMISSVLGKMFLCSFRGVSDALREKVAELKRGQTKETDN